MLYSGRQDLIVKGAELISLKNEHRITRRRQGVSPVQMICQQKRFEADKLIDDNVDYSGLANEREQCKTFSVAKKNVWKLLS